MNWRLKALVKEMFRHAVIINAAILSGFLVLIYLMKGGSPWIMKTLVFKVVTSSFGNTFDVSKLEAQVKNGKMILSLKNSQIKLEVEKSIRVLDAGITKLNQNGPSGDEDWSLLSEAEIMLGELKQLSTAPSMSDEEVERNISTIEVIFKKLEARKLSLKPLLDSLFLPNSDTKTPAESSQANISSGGQNNNNNNNNNSNKGRKENPKSKKGRKNGKGRRK